MAFSIAINKFNSQHNDTQHNDTQHNDTQHNDTQHNDGLVLLSILHAECNLYRALQISLYAECCYAKCHYAECPNANCRGTYNT
jgi:hypothetical protein